MLHELFTFVYNTGNNKASSFETKFILDGLVKLNDSSIYLLTDDPESNVIILDNQIYDTFDINTEVLFTLYNNPDEFNEEAIIEMIETGEVSRIEIPIFDDDLYTAISGIKISKGIVLDFNVVPEIESPLLGYKRCLYLEYRNIINSNEEEVTLYCFKEDDYDTLFNVLNSLFTPTPILHHYEVSDVTDNNESELFKYLDSHIK